MVPLSAWTCRNLGVLTNAQTRRVQSDVQSARYSAPMSNACERSVLLSGFTNPDSTKTTPSCPDVWNSQYRLQNSIHISGCCSCGQSIGTKSLEKSGPFWAFWEVPACFFLLESSSPSLEEPIQDGRLLLEPDILLGKPNCTTLLS